MTSPLPLPLPPIDYKRRYTEAEYYALEEQGEYQHEYFDGYLVPKYGYERDEAGQIVGMAGASIRHNRITRNTLLSLHTRLAGGRCEALAQDTMLVMNGAKTYPDVIVSCNPIDLKAERLWHQPTLIIEVLSNSTASRDREWKLERYRQIASLQQYVLVSQYRIWVESYDRPAEGSAWPSSLFTKLTDELPIPALDLRLPLTELYAYADLAPMEVMQP